ncbi:TAXI family TRAP transporter solute-binding subunit [Kribbella sp. NPDC048915]|uniref:TAXI family TRAP transporter solute-binding subunit n=1 Tax=Kribbella sp. NPDC048915 TaxID=3155148 RepID=UPI0033C5C9BF
MDRPRLFPSSRPSGLPEPGSARMTRRGVLGLGAAAASGVLLPGCARGRADEPAPAGPAVFATGNAGGVYNTFGTAVSALVSEVTGQELKPIVTDGSVDNLFQVAGNKADLGLCTSDSALAAYEGTGAFATGKRRFTALARVYDNYVHVVVPMASKATELIHLNPNPDDPNARKMVVGVGPKNSGTEIVANKILAAAGVDVIKRNMTLGEMVAAIQPRGQATKGALDAFVWSGGVPTLPIANLQKTIGFRLLDIGKQAQAIAVQEFGGFVVSSVPPSQYGLAKSVPTLAVPNYLVARPNLPDSWAWWTVNTLFRRQNDLIPDHPEAGALDPRSAIATMPVPLHPAAERWYRQNHI